MFAVLKMFVDGDGYVHFKLVGGIRAANATEALRLAKSEHSHPVIGSEEDIKKYCNH